MNWLVSMLSRKSKNEKHPSFVFGEIIFHIGDRKKYELIDFSKLTDDLCYVRDLHTGEIRRCLAGSLKKVRRPQPHTNTFAISTWELNP